MTKPLHSIERLRAFLEALPEEPPEPARLVIVGGGAAGVEMALNVSARFLAQGRPRDLHLSLVEASGCLLSMFPRGMGEYASELLRDRGVALHLSAQVERITEAMLLLDDGTALPHDAVLWATGATGQRLFAEAGLACDQRNFLRVNQALQCPDYPWLFAAGDCAVVEGMETLARVGVHAVKQGPVLHTNLSRVLAGLQTGRPLDAVSLEDFKPYPLAPLILSTGADEALMVAGRLWLRGTWMLRLKHRADLAWIKNYWLHRSQELSWRELFNARSVLDSPGPILGL